MPKADLHSLGLKPQYTFDQLVVGSHNQMAAAACLQVAKNLGDAYNPLFIYGPTGVGKTHMIHAIANAALISSPHLIVKYVSAERFVNDVISAISEDNLVGFRQHYNQLELLLLDDVQFLLESKSAQGEFLHVFNNLHQQNRQVVLTSDRSPHQLETFDKSIRSRFEWGLSADIKLPDIVTRIEILRLKQKNYGMNLSEEALSFVSKHLYSNVRELEGFLKRLHAYVTLSHQPISMGLINNVVAEIAPADASTRPLPDEKSDSGSKPVIASSMVVPSAENGHVENTPVAPPVKVPSVEPIIVPETNGHKIEPVIISLAPPPQPPGPPSTPPPIYSQVVPIERMEPPAIAAPPEKVSPPPVRVGEEVKTPKAPEPEKPVVVHAQQTPSGTDFPEPEVADPSSLVSYEGADAELEPLPAGHKEVQAVFFYPAGCEQQLTTVIQKFEDVIKKHKLKFRLRRVSKYGYEFKEKVNYSSFVEVCKINKAPVAIVVGPPSGGAVTDQEFFDLLSVTLDVQGISLQLVAWHEISKDYRYLNLALDIALVKAK